MKGDTPLHRMENWTCRLANGSVLTESSCEPCPLDWKFFQGSCYFFSLDNLTWTQANDSCARKQAHLVIINSRAEQVGKGRQNLRGWGEGLYKNLGVHISVPFGIYHDSPSMVFKTCLILLQPKLTAMTCRERTLCTEVLPPSSDSWRSLCWECPSSCYLCGELLLTRQNPNTNIPSPYSLITTRGLRHRTSHCIRLTACKSGAGSK